MVPENVIKACEAVEQISADIDLLAAWFDQIDMDQVSDAALLAIADILKVIQKISWDKLKERRG